MFISFKFVIFLSIFLIGHANALSKDVSSSLASDPISNTRSLSGIDLNKTIIIPKSSDDPLLKNVYRLLANASLAQQVQKSSDESVLKHYQQAIRNFNQAYNANDKSDMTKHLNLARTNMFRAAQESTPKKVLKNKLLADFNKKHKSIDSLLKALKRIADEKNIDIKKFDSTITHIKKLENTADNEVKSGDIKMAAQTLNNAYLLVKTSLQNLRQGDTLVRSLTFESKEEEYDYELDRNQTHFMLLALLIQKKAGLSDYSKKKINEFKSTANDLAVEAKKHALAKNYEHGIKSLEKSTKNLIRAIRIGGVFIPG